VRENAGGVGWRLSDEQLQTLDRTINDRGTVLA
jgi:hypothetical protein